MPLATGVEDRLRELLGIIPGGTSQTSQTQWEARCPAHDDRTASLCIGRLGSGGIGVCCQAGCSTESVMAVLNLPMSHLQPPRVSQHGTQPTGTIVATYDYRDTDGTLLFQVCRFEPKDFRQRKPNGSGGWDWSVKGIKQVPYRLPELLAADAEQVVLIVEGEKDADRLRSLGLVATCNSGGAAKANPKSPKPRCKWTRKSHAEYLSGRNVCIIADNDQAGRDHANGVANSLSGIARSIKILSLPNLPEKGDASDWLNNGGTAAELIALATSAAEWTENTLASEKPIAHDGSKHAPWPGHKLTDLGNAERFAGQLGDDVRYCYAWGSWLVWDGTRWAVDAMGDIERRAKRTVRAIYAEAANADTNGEAKEIAKWAEESEKRNAINAMIALARSEQPIPVAVSSLDSEAWLLNCENGTANLVDGTLHEHRQSDFITKKCPVEYPDGNDGGDDPLTWLAFLDRIFASNAELIGFVQRLMGMSLVGEVREHILPIFWGTGQNGKSTLLETFCGILGKDYSMKAPDGFLMEKKHNEHPTALADLHGKRVVSAIETGEKSRLNESLIKELTGGDTIRARRMRQDFWEFQPSHTVIIATNHKPTIQGTDFGIWRRVCLVPFIVTIPENERDSDLKNKLRAEWPQILKWAVNGCIQWSRNGLQPPEMVQVATEEYKNNSDIFGSFIDECCLVGPSYRVKASTLYEMYKSWAKRGGEEAEAQTKFGLLMNDRGFEKKKISVYWYMGITNRESGEDSESVGEEYAA